MTLTDARKIDCHVHVVACLANLGHNAQLPDSIVAPRALGIMNAMLMRGFTSALGRPGPVLAIISDLTEAISNDEIGAARDVLQQLPMEFAVEAQKLIAISLEGSVG